MGIRLINKNNFSFFVLLSFQLGQETIKTTIVSWSYSKTFIASEDIKLGFVTFELQRISFETFSTASQPEEPISSHKRSFQLISFYINVGDEMEWELRDSMSWFWARFLYRFQEEVPSRGNGKRHPHIRRLQYFHSPQFHHRMSCWTSHGILLLRGPPPSWWRI